MEESAPRKRRRWPWMILAVVVIVPIVGFVVINILFVVNAVRPDQEHIPRDLVKFEVNSDAATQTPNRPALKKFETFDDFLAASPNKTFGTIYTEWSKKFSDEEWWNSWPLANWRYDEPLSATQTAWLFQNREFIDTLLRVIKERGVPVITNQEAAALCEKYLNDSLLRGGTELIPAPKYSFYGYSARILCADSQRLRDAGDFGNAADRINAVCSLAQEIHEPGLESYLIALEMQLGAGRELAHWLSSAPPSAELAANMRAELADKAVSMDQYRSVLEIEHYYERAKLVQELTGPFSNLWSYNMFDIVIHSNRDNATDDPGFIEYVGNFISLHAKNAAKTISMKASASTVLDQSDAKFREVLKEFDANDPTKEKDTQPKSFFDRNWAETRQRTRTNLARFRVNLIGLDLAAGKTATTEIDPFANQPLSRVVEDKTELIYSIGPDLKDNGGAVNYDPTNGSFSAGDIVLRVPKNLNKR